MSHATWMLIRSVFLMLGIYVVAACTGGTVGTAQNTVSIPYTVGGSVSGLSGSGLVLQNNGGDSLPVAADGSFTFATPLYAGNAYNVSVVTQPSGPNQTCTPGNAIGTVANSSVTAVTITCVAKVTATDTIGGSVQGLVGTGLVLENNGADDLSIGADGQFAFPTPLNAASPYSVTVLSPPIDPDQSCIVTNGQGTAGSADVNNVAVTCTVATGAAFAIGGTVTGLPAGSSLLLKDNGRDDLTITADGAFTFATPVPSGTAYSVTFAATSAQSLSCSISNSNAIVQGAAVTNVAITCTSQSALTVMVSGLAGTGLVLQTDSGDTLPVSANGAATFATALGAGAPYTVSVLTQPTNPAQQCLVGNASGTIGKSAPPTVSCAATGVPVPTLVTIGGSVSQLAGSGLVLLDNGGDNLAITASGNFTFHTPISVGSTYAVTVATQPSTPAQTCTVTNATGIAAANVTNVSVVCPAVLTALQITPAAPGAAKGFTQALTATGIYSDGSRQNLTAQATWSSSNAGIASVSNAATTQGVVTAVAVGTATISAAFGAATTSVTFTVTAATLTAISVTPANPNVPAGQQQQFTATGIYSDNSTSDLTAQVTWASSNATAATISNGAGTHGDAATLVPGTSTISATVGPITGTSTLTVTAAALVSIAVTPVAPSIAAGLTQQFAATGTYTDNSTHDLTTQATWSSSDTAVATISNAAGSKGLATSVTVGASTMTATFGGRSGNSTLTVSAATLVSLAVTPSNPSVAAGATVQLTATGTYSDQSTRNLTTQVAWSTSDSGSAVVSNATGSQGLVTGDAVGTASISAQLNGQTGSTTVTVTAATLTALTVTPTTPGVAAGFTLQFAVVGTYSDGSTHDVTTQVTWSSATTNVATISNAVGSKGLASTFAVGTSVITASLGGISGSTTLSVTTAVLVSIAVTPANPTIYLNQNQQFIATGTYSDATTQVLTTQVTWASSDQTIATISNAAQSNGLATSSPDPTTGVTAQGTTTISAALGSFSGSTSLTVTAPPLVSVTVTPANASLPLGENQQFTATANYADGSTVDVTQLSAWSSSNPIIASITSSTPGVPAGFATSNSQGSVTISALYQGVTGTTGLTVTPPVLISIAVTPANAGEFCCSGQQFTATGTYSDRSTADVTLASSWASSSTAIVTITNTPGVTGNGFASGVGAGTATITATLAGISGSTSFQVDSPVR